MPNLQPYSYRPSNRQPSSAIPLSTTVGGVDSPSASWAEMWHKWELIQDLLGGTLAMRQAGKKWLPPEPRENPQGYEARLNRSYLYGAFRDTVQKLAAKPFSKPTVLSGKLPELLKEITHDADLQGRDLTQFARHIFEDGLKWGLSHILVDFPATGGGLSLADERSQGIRPYFVHVSPLDLIAWQSNIRADGGEELTQVRFRERRTEYDDTFGETAVDYIRVINQDSWELWRKPPKEEEYLKIEEGTHSFGAVPMMTFYTTRADFMKATPPLEDLAWMNLAHWQSLSDQRNILRFARVGILFASGFSEEEIESGISIGPSNMISSTNPEAKMSYVEHSGNAIGAGENDLTALEARMEVLGLQPLVESTGGVTATARAMDEARTHSNIQAWIRGLENAFEGCYAMAAQWANSPLPEDFAVDVFNDFGISLSATEDVRALMDMRVAGLITQQTFLEEVKRRGVLADEVDIESEMENLESAISEALDLLPPQPLREPEPAKEDVEPAKEDAE